MAIQLRIPTVMRANTAGQAVVECSGDTIEAILNDLTSQHPDLKDVLFNKNGDLHKYVNIYVDSDDIRYIGGLKASTEQASEITILPAVAGGV